MRLVVTGDVHLTESPPGRRSETYYEDIREKLFEIREDVLSVPDTVWVFIGDLFHHKQANRVSHRMVQSWIDLLTCGHEVVIVPGNHDLADGTVESIERQPLGVLARLPNVTVLDDLRDITVGTESAKVLGVPGTGPVCDASEEALDLFDDEADIVFAHAPVAFRPLPWPTYDPTHLPIRADLLVYGHQHDKAGPVGSWHSSVGKNYEIAATGAIARGSVSEADNDPAYLVVTGRRPGAWSVETKPIRCARPASDIYRWADRAVDIADDARTASFIASLSEARLSGFSVEGLIHQIRGRQDLDASVKAKAVEILEGI